MNHKNIRIGEQYQVPHHELLRFLEQAVAMGCPRFTPSEAYPLPRVIPKEPAPLGNADILALLRAAQGHPMGTLFKVMLFTGMREAQLEQRALVGDIWAMPPLYLLWTSTAV